MKEIFALLIITILGSSTLFAQDYKNADFTIKNEVSFDIKSDYRKSNTTEDTDVIVFRITVTNNGDTPIPDLGATMRSDHLNFIVNDSIQNPISLYNGVEPIGDHLIHKNKNATYEWWIYADDSYGEEFTVQWQYLKTLSSKHKVDTKAKTIKILKD